MTERQKECVLEIQDLIIAINNVVKKYELENEFLAVLAVGFLDMESQFTDAEGSERWRRKKKKRTHQI